MAANSSGLLTGLLTAGSGQQWESDLVADLDQPGATMTVIRRCADIGEVLAIAVTGRARVAALDGNLRRLDTEAVQRLSAAGVAVIGVFPAADLRSKQRLDRLGIAALVADDEGPAAVQQAARVALATLDPDPVEIGQAADPSRALPPPFDRDGAHSDGGDDDPAIGSEPTGVVIAVWGPTGAPGRSMTALGLADAMAAGGRSTLLIDGDVYGGVLAAALGVLDESPGVAGACRAASNGRLGPTQLDRLCWQVAPSLRLLTGISRADRWPELRPSALAPVLAAARALASVTIVDCGFCLEADEELSFDTLAPRRNGATLTFLAGAECVVAVGSADPAGLERLIRGLGQLTETLPAVRPEVVLNRVRPGAGSAAEATDALRRFTGLTPAVTLPEDRSATDAAWKRGALLSAAAPKSPLRAGFRTLASELSATISRSTADALPTR